MGLGLAALTPVHAQAVKETDNREMTAMFDADQATRQSIDPAQPIDAWRLGRCWPRDG